MDLQKCSLVYQIVGRVLRKTKVCVCVHFLSVSTRLSRSSQKLLRYKDMLVYGFLGTKNPGIEPGLGRLPLAYF
jgi:hypothetical protein